MLAASPLASPARERPLALAALTLAFACWALTACASVSDGCRKDYAECVKRCEKSTDDRSTQDEVPTPENTMSDCESRCSCRDPAPPKAAGKPTPTGYATGTTP
jgi:hypothetical protein